METPPPSSPSASASASSVKPSTSPHTCSSPDLSNASSSSSSPSTTAAAPHRSLPHPSSITSTSSAITDPTSSSTEYSLLYRRYLEAVDENAALKIKLAQTDAFVRRMMADLERRAQLGEVSFVRRGPPGGGRAQDEERRGADEYRRLYRQMREGLETKNPSVGVQTASETKTDPAHVDPSLRLPPIRMKKEEDETS